MARVDSHMVHRFIRAVVIATVGGWTALLVSPRVLRGQRPGTDARVTGQPPVLTAFTVNGGADTVSSAAVMITLDHALVGARPSEYRVSHRADFSGAAWISYLPAPTLRDWYDASGAACDAKRPSHRVTFYLQVRASVGEEVRIVDGQRQLVPARVESNVLRATICAREATSS